ncbi:hypothetical protein NADFUDRAFT_72060 [Nadsonia fulvescens var. elongata DSM 6958]|uniref:Uncharacterized protein n=1 Tax=Nadsonia fulvescens var. elongata DSM 6958 TaxID=857566 RepID=A0A1E3PCW9_9ASCO|nr:hypothetical protein NADFUDRAFT_72060 [Nadsonia fulvescens var. elongata DSM 6958]
MISYGDEETIEFSALNPDYMLISVLNPNPGEHIKHIYYTSNGFASNPSKLNKRSRLFFSHKNEHMVNAKNETLICTSTFDVHAGRNP